MPVEISHDEKSALMAEARTLLALPESAKLELALLAGGATGQTFKLEATIVDAEEGEATTVAISSKCYVLRTLRPSRQEDRFLSQCSETLAKAAIGPKVLAKSDRMLLCEFVAGENASIKDLCEGAESLQIKAIATTLGKYHDLPLESIAEPLRSWSGDEFSYWLGLIEKTWVGENKIPADFQAVIDANVAQARAYTIELVATASSSSSAAGEGTNPPTSRFAKMLSTTTVTHGDFHPNNILMKIPNEDAESSYSCVIVDHEMTKGRPAVFDIAYHFMVLGDMRYSIGWTPSPGEPGPYAPLASRQAFARHYLSQRLLATAMPRINNLILQQTASGAETTIDAGAEEAMADGVSVADITEFLFEVEKFVYAERVRLFLIWLLLAGGDPKHMLFGGAQLYLPRMTIARDLLLEAAAGNEELKQEIVRRGIIQTANVDAEAKH